MKNRKQIVFGVVVAIIVLLNIPLPVSLLIRTGTRDNLAAYQTLLTILFTRVRSTLEFVWDADGIMREKQKMQGDIAALHFQVEELKALEEDNDTLRKLLQFKGRQRHRLIMCQVTARGGMGGWWQTLQLDKGTEQGVAANRAVITMEGVIGRTGDSRGDGEPAGLVVSRRTSDVLLITDPDCKVSCRVQRTGALGIVRGRGGALGGDAELEMLSGAEPCHMDFIPKTSRIEAGDVVVTSGLGGVYPEGLIVGKVQKVSMDRSGLFQRAEVQPAADLSSVKYAFVVAADEAPAGEPLRVQGSGERVVLPTSRAPVPGVVTPGVVTPGVVTPGVERLSPVGRPIPSYKRPLSPPGDGGGSVDRVERVEPR